MSLGGVGAREEEEDEGIAIVPKSMNGTGESEEKLLVIENSINTI